MTESFHRWEIEEMEKSGFAKARGKWNQKANAFTLFASPGLDPIFIVIRMYVCISVDVDDTRWQDNEDGETALKYIAIFRCVLFCTMPEEPTDGARHRRGTSQRLRIGELVDRRFRYLHIFS